PNNSSAARLSANARIMPSMECRRSTPLQRVQTQTALPPPTTSGNLCTSPQSWQAINGIRVARSTCSLTETPRTEIDLSSRQIKGVQPAASTGRRKPSSERVGAHPRLQLIQITSLIAAIPFESKVRLLITTADDGGNL